jgi:predicted DNA-binding transcriptional regulator AlpA
MTSMCSRIRQRRRQLDRAGVATRTGASLPTVDAWHRCRTATGFPDKVDTDAEGRDWWWQDDIDAFHTAHLATRAAQFTQVDRRGNPDDLLSAPQAAKVLGYRDHRSLTAALLDRPDDVTELPSGRLRRRWYRRTIWAYADDRVSHRSTGRPVGTGTGSSHPYPYADDPRLDATMRLLAEAEADGRGAVGLGAELARQLDITERTARRLLGAARRVSHSTPAPPR